jgi:hypothetical protein
MRLRRLGIVVILFSCSACSGGGAEPASSTPELASCKSAWHEMVPLHSTYDAFAPGEMCWQDGTLYYAQVDARVPLTMNAVQIVAVPETGGTPTAIVANQQSIDGFWLEGDHVLLARADQLYQVPISGGTPELIADGHTFTSAAFEEAFGFPVDHTFDGSFLYWEAQGVQGVHGAIVDERTVWRLSRAGDKDAEKLGTVSKDAGLAGTLVALPDRLLLAGYTGHAYTMPKSGGSARALPAVANALLAGAGPGGVLWTVGRPAVNGLLTADLKLSKPSASKTEAFWPDEPRDLDPDHAWADNSSSWIVSAVESFSDGERHRSVWSVDLDGHASRLACNPDNDSSEAESPSVAVLTPDALFFVLKHRESARADAGDPGPAWSIVRVPR